MAAKTGARIPVRAFFVYFGFQDSILVKIFLLESLLKAKKDRSRRDLNPDRWIQSPYYIYKYTSFFINNSLFFASSSSELSGPKTEPASLRAVIFLLASAISFSSDLMRSSTEALAC